MVALTDVARKNLIFLRNRINVAQVGTLTDGWSNIQGSRIANARRNRLVDKLVQISGSNGLKHGTLFLGLGADMAAFETSLHGGRNLGFNRAKLLVV